MIFIPPTPITYSDKPSIFLGGSIEDGNAPNWQPEAAQILDKMGYDVYNPRREKWGTLEQKELEFQINWELTGIETADIVLINLVSGTKSPISLLELGLCAGNPYMTPYVVCQPDFYRYTNVKVVCDRFGLKLLSSLEEFYASIDRQ